MLGSKKLLGLLSDGEFHSGEALGAALGISRAAVWKRLQLLEALDIWVESAKGKGYRIQGGVSLLDADIITDLLPVAVRQQLAQIHLFDELDSTNRFLLDRPSGAREACLAERQTAGKGRRGRIWFSPYGKNLYLSVSWTFHQGVAAVQGLSLAVGVALVEGLEELGLSGARLKWPNDVLLQGKKLGGVLIELSGDAAGECRVVVGVGMNLAMSDLPAEVLEGRLDQPWADLKSAGLACDRNRLSSVLIRRLVELLADYPERGFQYYRAAWQAYNAHANCMVELTTPAAKVTGRMLGVGDDGALLLATSRGERVFSGGEISLRQFDGH